MNQQVSIYDYLLIAFYLVFMVFIGLLHKSKNKDTSDYFRGGGAISWWLVGASAFVTVFSAWTFVGCAGKVYYSGTIAALIFIFNGISLLFTLWLGPKLRRLRVITWVSAIRDRFGFLAEQFYAWITMFVGFALGGVALYTLAVFMAPIFNISVTAIIIIVGVVITIMASAGGSKGLIASDFVQCLVIVFVAITTAFMVLRMPEVGGVEGLIDKVPVGHFKWSEYESSQVLWFWGIAIFVNQFISTNNLQAGAAKYITVKNEKHARLAVIIPFFGMFLLPVVAFIPPLAATFIFPNLPEMYSGLNNPGEAAYVAVAMKVLPRGMIGLLASAIFAASLTSLNAALTINASVFVKNIYRPLFRKSASEKELLTVSRFAMIVLGLILIVIGLKFSEIKDLPLFDITMLIAGLISIPIMIPLFLGIIIKNTPSWSSWSTVLLGLASAAAARFIVPTNILVSMLGLDREFTKQEEIDAKFAFTVIVAATISITWFLLTRLFYNYQPQSVKDSIKDFSLRLQTPIDENVEKIEDSTADQASMGGKLSLTYGMVILLCVIIPNQLSGRLCFVFCGGGMIFVGLLLIWAARKNNSRVLDMQNIEKNMVSDSIVGEPVSAVVFNDKSKL
jgi:solute:Na+ symporter, SSS family